MTIEFCKQTDIRKNQLKKTHFSLFRFCSIYKSGLKLNSTCQDKIFLADFFVHTKIFVVRSSTNMWLCAFFTFCSFVHINQYFKQHYFCLISFSSNPANEKDFLDFIKSPVMTCLGAQWWCWYYDENLQYPLIMAFRYELPCLLIDTMGSRFTPILYTVSL